MPGKKLSILVIDHDQDCRDALRLRLQAQDYVVAEADTGERAMTMLHVEKFDFVFLDANMSDVGSAEIVRRIRADGKIQETRIVVGGARLNKKAIEECLRNGANAHLDKPYDIVAVKSLLWKHRAGANKTSPMGVSPAKPASAAVLVVDDSEVNLDLLSRRLKNAGFHVICATNGAQSLRLLDSAKYDVVLLDIMMPQLSGIEVLKQIRSNPKTKQISVIMLSAMDDSKTIDECLQLGADDYMTKPFDSRTLTACIESQLLVKRARDDSHFRKSMGLDDAH